MMSMEGMKLNDFDEAILSEWGMVFVEGGTFMMGATPEQEMEAYDWEKPAHQVTLSDFYIGK